VRGFSGYSLELLILAYGSFLGFCKKAAKWKPIVFIDLEGHYKNLQEALEHIDKAKLSPILLIDPVQKDRNVLAALSMENFLKVKRACVNFLKNPSIKFFEKKPVDVERIKQIAKRKKARFVAIHLLQEAKEDVARAKAVKFYKALMREIEKNCDVLHSAIDYRDDGALLYFVVSEKKDIVVRGPPLELEQAVKAFKAKHKETFVKGKRIFAREKPKALDKILSDVLADRKSYKIKSCKVEID
jgi:tRNA nucleotidyltransferase (CCA-adding enzyme)